MTKGKRDTVIANLSWRDLANFRERILRALGLRVIRKRLTKNQSAYLQDEATHARIELLLPSIFKSVEVFHGCRPENIESYYSKGLLPLDIEQGKRIAKNLFLSSHFPELSDQDIELAAARIGSAGWHGHLYVALDDRRLVQAGGHYLVSGSEYVQGIAAELQRMKDRDYHQHLRSKGTPTVFVCSLPLGQVSPGDRKQLATALAEEIVSDPAFKHTESTPIDFSFFLRTKLTPECVLNHYHPKVISDPHRQMLSYQW